MDDTQSDEQRAWDALTSGAYQESARLYELLAKRGSTHALVNLGRMYKNGQLGAPDLDKAMSYFERAANVGSAPAKYSLAQAWITKGDPHRARVLLLEAAEQGHTPSMNKVGGMLVSGQGGDVDVQAGTEWLTRAASGGHVYAERELLRLRLEASRSFGQRMLIRWKILRLVLSVLARANEQDLKYSDDFR